MHLKFQIKGKEIAERYIMEAHNTAIEGFARSGPGVVIMRIDVDSESCEIVWRPADDLIPDLKKRANCYNPQSEFVVAIGPSPFGQFEGQGYMVEVLPLTPTIDSHKPN